VRRAAIAALGVSVLLVVSPTSAARKSLGAATPPLRLVPKAETLTVHGLHDYLDTIEIGSAGDGLTVSNRLTLERYLLGLNEVPTSWPTEALRAQVIAARTYALWTMSQPPGGDAAVYGFDICATVQCQVFSGAEVLATPDGARWAQAVQDTKGQAILYDGAPILARYHSTSGGATFDNADAFPGERNYPYLKAVTSTTETASSVYRWEVVFTRGRLTKILRHAGTISGGRVVDVRTAPSDSGSIYPDVIVRTRSGSGSQAARMIADDFRDAVRESAPALYPDLYPSLWPTTSGRLPEVLPSERIVIRTRGERIQVNGRGWGHGVGMSQWGAHGLAQQGATAAEILGHYYTGVSLGSVDTDVPIEVGVSTGQSQVTVSGSFSIVDGEGTTLVRNALGTWTFTNAGGAVGIDTPEGYGLPLEVGIVRAPKRVEVGEPVFLTIALSRPAEVRAETVGLPERNPRERVRDAGKRKITWLAPIEAGRYRVRVRAAAGPTRRFSDVVPIVVKEPQLVEPDVAADEPTRRAPNRTLIWVVLGLVLALLTVASYLLKRAASLPGRDSGGE
jgi:stage II sporulation protein D